MISRARPQNTHMETLVKRPFLRKGTGLKRFYKGIDIASYFSSITADSPAGDTRLVQNDQANHAQLHIPLANPSSVLKSADSPKRNLSVRFSRPRENGTSARTLDFGESDQDKENCNPDTVGSSTSDVKELSYDSDEEEPGTDWETEDDDEDNYENESVIELNESVVDEVFKSILKAKAERELIPRSNLDPVLGNTDSLAQTNGNGQPMIPPSLPSSFELELEMFEKMEQMTAHQSFCSTASTVRRFVNTELHLSPITDSPPAAPPPPLEHPKTASVETLKYALALDNHQLRTLLQPSQSQPTTSNPAIDTRKRQLEQDDAYLRTLLLTRIHQLESEIIQHRTNNQRLRDLRAALESERKALSQKKDDFESRQTREMNLVDELKRRLKRDQEKVTKELNTAKKSNSTEEQTASELESMRNKIIEMEKDFKVRTSRWASSARNFKGTIDELKSDNSKLQKTIEELRNDKFKLHQRMRRTMKLPPASPDTAPALLVPPVPIPEEVDPATGARRVFGDNGYCLEVHYPNGDIKDLRQIGTTGVSRYYFKEADSWEILSPDGTQTLEFGTGEIQTKFPNGLHEIKYASGTIRRIYPDGTEECVHPDKTVIRTGTNGEREIHMANGQIEHHSPNLKLRIYPDGTEKVLYNDGSSLTRYSSGRQRFRNPQGDIVYDRPGPTESCKSDCDITAGTVT